MLITKKIGFLGVQKHDLCIYLGRVIHHLGHRVLTVDNSAEQQLKYCIPMPELPGQSFVLQGVEYGFQMPLDHIDISGYDYVFEDLGKWSPRQQSGYDEIYLVTDPQVMNMEQCRYLLQKLQNPVNLVLRDMCAYKIQDKRVIHFFEQEKTKIRNLYMIEQDILDYEYRIQMQYEPCREFHEISAGMEKTIMRMAQNITARSWMDIMYAYRAARRGELFDHCFLESGSGYTCG